MGSTTIFGNGHQKPSLPLYQSALYENISFSQARQGLQSLASRSGLFEVVKSVHHFIYFNSINRKKLQSGTYDAL